MSQSWHGFMISFLFTKLGLAPIIPQANFLYLRNMHWSNERKSGEKKYIIALHLHFPNIYIFTKNLIKSLKVQNPIVLSLAFSCIELVVIVWVSWCKNKSFWQRFTCMHNACRIVDSMQTFYGGRPLYVLGIRWLLARLIQFDLQ